MSAPGEYDPDEAPAQWKAGADEEREKRGDKPPKGKKEKKTKKGKADRENPDFDDVPGYEGGGFRVNNEAAPPPAKGPSGEPAKIDFPDTKHLSDKECQDALKHFVDKNFCYGSKPSIELEIKNKTPQTALHYTLETFTESRSTKKKKKPYKGGYVDGPENGAPPAVWNIECPYKKPFKDDKIKFEVPHTSKVKKCKDCKGRGWETCDDCDGWGKVECDVCDGSGNTDDQVCWICLGTGQTSCNDCGGDGRVTCDDCDGYKKLRCFIQLKVEFKNHDDDYILETSDMPDELVAKVKGDVIFEEELPMVFPIQGCPEEKINQNSKKLVDIHRDKWPKEHIHLQRQKLRGVPVTEVDYRWDQGSYRFWVFGKERKVHAPDYPQQCCCGCSII